MSFNPVHTVLWRECGLCGWSAQQSLRIIDADVEFQGDGVKTLSLKSIVYLGEEMNILKFIEEHKCPSS